MPNLNNQLNASPRFDAEEAKVIADWLDVIRESLDGHESISDETQSELQTYLALAEATLRRASVEVDISDAIITLFRPH